MNPGTVLVVGATGFVGRSVSRTLHAEGWRVRAAARRRLDGPWDEFSELDISAPPERWPMDGVDALVLAAGLAHDVHGSTTTEEDYERVNARGAANAAAAAREGDCSQLVLVSSVKAMADRTPGGPLTERDACHPTTPYGLAKLRGEQLAFDALQDSPCRLAIVRLTPVYGIGSKGNLKRLLRLAGKRWMPLLPADCGERSMIHVDDVASLVATMLRKDVVGTLIADDGRRYSPRKVQQRVREELGLCGWTASLPASPFRLTAVLASAGKRVAVLRRVEADLSRLLDASLFDGSHGHARLEWRPRRTLWSELGDLVREPNELAEA